jgi:acyl carrier protein
MVPKPERAQAPASGLAITSLISGILSWIIVPVLGSIVAIVTGHLARGEIHRAERRLGGLGMATAGLILGYASLLVFVLVLAVIVTTTVMFDGALQRMKRMEIEHEQASEATRQAVAAVLVEDRVRSLVALQMGLPVEVILPETSLAELGADELDQIEILLELEESFDMTITDDEAASIETIGDLIRLVQAKATNLGTVRKTELDVPDVPASPSLVP